MIETVAHVVTLKCVPNVDMMVWLLDGSAPR